MEESLGPGNLWMSITKAISDMQKSSVQVCRSVVRDDIIPSKRIFV